MPLPPASRWLPVPLPSLAKATLSQTIHAMHGQAVAVLGDMALDEMIYGQVDRLSREAPVIILRHQESRVILGAAANAAHNIARLGGQTSVFGICGEDLYAEALKNAFHQASIDTKGLLSDGTRPTTTKSRISGRVSQSITQQMLRLDRESREPLSISLQQQLQTLIQSRQLPKALLLSDYGLGVLQPKLIREVLDWGKAQGICITVDSQGDLSHYHGAFIMTPNQPEAEHNLGRSLGPALEDWLEGGLGLLQHCGSEHLLITRGQDGMLLLEQSRKSGTVRAYLLPVFNPREVFDVTGAGDTVVGTLTLALATGASLLESAVLGNLAASLVVRQYGCATVTPEELLQALADLEPKLLEHIVVYQTTP